MGHPRNSECPCGSGLKYKNCCLKKGVYEAHLTSSEYLRSLTIRGKNLYFYSRILDALQIDADNKCWKNYHSTITAIKKAITPSAVRKIHEAVIEVWPDRIDYLRCLKEDQGRESGLYIGNHQLDVTVNVFNRHALYDERILMIDVFNDPRIVNEQFNPLINPQNFIATTFHGVMLWLQMIPWIEHGLVGVIRNPGDFDTRLLMDSFLASEKRASNEELKQELESSEHPPELHEYMRLQFGLSRSDEEFRAHFSGTEEEWEAFKRELNSAREKSRYYIDAGRHSQYIQISTGTNYEMAKYICGITGSHIITDINYRWKEMEYDRNTNGVRISQWSAIAKALQNAKIKHLNGLELNDLLKLRTDGYLDDMRSFLRRLWKSSAKGDDLDPENSQNLAAELIDKINESEKEWKKIDTNLIQWFGGPSVVGGVLGISLAKMNWVPAVSIVAMGAIQLAVSSRQRSDYLRNYPAGFFVETIRNST